MNKRLLWALLSWLSLLSIRGQAQNLAVQETFERLSTDFGYSNNTVTAPYQTEASVEYFERRAFTTVTGGTGYAGTTQGLNNRQGSFTWAGEGVRGTQSANFRPAGYVVLNPITNSQNYRDFVITVAMAAPRGGAFTGFGANATLPSDRIRIQYSFGGGPWTTVKLLMGNNRNNPGLGDFEDIVPLSDSSRVAQGGTNTPTNAGTVLDQTYRDITATLPANATGTNLRVRVVLDFRSGEAAFDNIRVTGTLDNTAKPALSGVETPPLTYTEGSSQVQITNSLQVTHPSATTLAGGSVTISGFVAGDFLNYVNQNGITGSYNTGNGVLTLTGTATLATYQAALRSIAYQNTNTTTLPRGTRPINFQVTDGNGVASGTVTRSVTVTPTLNNATSLNYTENFDADGEGTRYFGNSFANTASQTGFFRATSSPATSGGSTVSTNNFSGWSGGYWYGEGSEDSNNPNNPTSTLQLAPVNATGRANLRFTIAVGATSNWRGYNDAVNPGESFELFYRINGGTPVKFAAFYGTIPSGGPARLDGDLDITTVATGTALSTTLQDFTFNLPASAAVGNLDFLLVQRARGSSELAFDNIRITGVTPPTVTTATPSSITSNRAVLGGNVTADGGDAVTDRGVVYSATNQTPTTADTKDTNGMGTGAFSKTITGLAPATTYYVRAYAINAAGTSYGAAVSFTTAASVSGTVVVTNVSCVGGSNGTINLTPTGGVSPYTFLWNNGATTEDRTGLAAGTYSVTITDATGATGTVNNIIVTQPLAIGGTTLQVDIACNGSATGVASVSPTGGTAPYTYRWSTGATTQTITGLAAGSYSVIITDANGCTLTRNFTITEPAALTATTVQTNISCNGGTNGTASVTPAGGAGDYTYRWSTGATTRTITGLATGSYSVTVTDANDCSITRNFTITEPAALTATTSQTDVTTNGGSNGSATIMVSGGTPDYTYAWSPNVSTTATASNLSAGTYSVTATDANGCTITRSFTIAQPVAVTVVSVTRLTPSPTATTQVRYQVVFSANVTGLTVSNFSVTQTGLTGTSISSAVGSGTTYTVTANTGTGDGTLRVNVSNSNGISPTVTNVPYTAGEVYTITKTFSNPILTIQGTGGAGSDVTAFVDAVQVLRGGTAVANALQNGSFEQHDPLSNGDFGYQPTGASWTFNSRAGIAESGSAFSPTTPIPNGIAVAFIQSAGSINGEIQQGLTLPTGSYQVNFQASQRVCCTTFDQRLNVFINGVFIGNTQPGTDDYQAFTSTTFNVTAPALTASISSTAGASGSTTATSPIPVTVTFSQGATGFTASDVVVTGGTVSGFTGSGTTYTFNVTPSAGGTVTVNVPANSAFDGNNTGNTAATQFSLIYEQPTTATPVVTLPVDNTITNQAVVISGTAPANSRVIIYVSQNGGGYLSITTTTTANGTFSSPSLPFPSSAYRTYVTAQSQGLAVSANSNLINFLIDQTTPTVALSSTAGANGSTTTTTPIPYTVTFSESVTGFVAGDVTVSNGTISGFTGSGASYAFNVTPTTPGTATTVNIAAGIARDLAGNGNSAATQLSITYQPTLTSWTGLVSTDWYTADNWSAGVPNTAVDATVPASAPNMPAIAASTAQARNITLNAGATLTQTGGTLLLTANLTNNGTFAPTGGTVSLATTTLASILGSGNTRLWNLTIGANGAQLSTSASTSVQRLLTLNGSFATNGNPLTLESNATTTAVVVNNGSAIVNGNVTVQRYIDPSLNAGLGYRHYSAPISSASVASLATASFSPVVNPAYNTSATPTAERPFPTVYGYDQARLTTTSNNLPEFDKGWFSPATTSDALAVGQGYTLNTTAGQTLSVTGALNNGTLPLALASNRTTQPDGGWQLVGNPYAAPLDYSRVAAADRAGLDAAIYIYSSTGQYTGQYRTYVSGIGNPVVPSGQAFFARVAAGQASGTLTLRNNHRLTVPNNTSFLRTAAEARPLVQLTLKGTASPLSDEAFVYFANGATDGFDTQYDALKLPNTNGLNLSTSATGQQFSIDGRGELSSVQRVIPLAVGVPTPGTYSFTTAQLLNLDATPVYLRDVQLGTLTDLHTTPSYQFTVTNASALITGRFELVFSPQQALATVPAALAQQVALYPNPAKKAAFVELPASLGRQAVTAALVDALGRQVRTVTLPAQGALAHQLDLSELATGVYALRLSTSAGVVVKKLVIE